MAIILISQTLVGWKNIFKPLKMRMFLMSLPFLGGKKSLIMYDLVFSVSLVNIAILVCLILAKGRHLQKQRCFEVRYMVWWEMLLLVECIQTQDNWIIRFCYQEILRLIQVLTWRGIRKCSIPSLLSHCLMSHEFNCVFCFCVSCEWKSIGMFLVTYKLL